MNKKILLTSFIVIGFVCPAFATPSHTSSTFPSDGYMLEDYSYTGQATYENLGVYEGSVSASADYDNCPANSYCDGEAATNIVACSTLANGAYPNSNAGSTSSSDCYGACTASNTGITHGATFTGTAYYGGANNCELVSCDSGYHIKPAVPNIIQTKIGTGSATESAYKPYSGNQSMGDLEKYGISSDYGAFAINYGDGGILYGHSRCSKTQGYQDGVNNNNSTWNNPTKFNELADETSTSSSGGRYCYCQLDGYKETLESTKESISSLWVFVYESSESATCAMACANSCRTALASGSGSGWFPFRTAILGTLPPQSPVACVSDTITINWSDASAADIAANEAGTCTWGGAIRTPRAATGKAGKVFKGWKIVKD